MGYCVTCESPQAIGGCEAQRGGRRGPDRPGNGTAQFQPRGEQRGEGGPKSGRRGGGALAALELTAEQQEQLQALRETQHAEKETDATLMTYPGLFRKTSPESIKSPNFFLNESPVVVRFRWVRRA